MAPCDALASCRLRYDVPHVGAAASGYALVWAAIFLVLTGAALAVVDVVLLPVPEALRLLWASTSPRAVPRLRHAPWLSRAHARWAVSVQGAAGAARPRPRARDAPGGALPSAMGSATADRVTTAAVSRPFGAMGRFCFWGCAFGAAAYLFVRRGRDGAALADREWNGPGPVPKWLRGAGADTARGGGASHAPGPVGHERAGVGGAAGGRGALRPALADAPPGNATSQVPVLSVAAAATTGARTASGLRGLAAAVHISAAFDGGNVICEDCSGPDVRLRIRPDPFTKATDEMGHLQWFYFRASNVKGRPLTYTIVNAKEASFAAGWRGYRACASYDRRTWFRVPDTEYSAKTGRLRWALRSARDTVWFAYFAPYSYERHQALIGRCATAARARLTVLGGTLDGRPLDMVTVGDGPRKVWVCARQHPGETMAEWFAQGFLETLLRLDADYRLFAQATFHVVPNMNPDGSVRGHLRTNAAGANLNREWDWRRRFGPFLLSNYEAPTLERSPEVYHVLAALDARGCDVFVDVHGDECIEANFFQDTRGIPGWTPRLQRLSRALSDAMLRASPDFQTELGYPPDAPASAIMSICPHQVAERFDCLAVTLEMPFKDSTFNTPEPEHGWAPARAMRLGGSLVRAIEEVLPEVRGGGGPDGRSDAAGAVALD